MSDFRHPLFSDHRFAYWLRNDPLFRNMVEAKFSLEDIILQLLIARKRTMDQLIDEKMMSARPMVRLDEYGKHIPIPREKLEFQGGGAPPNNLQSFWEKDE